MWQGFQSFDQAEVLLPFVGLAPMALLPEWEVRDISVREEGDTWSTLWYLVKTPTSLFRVKQFFLDIMEPSFPDTCVTAAKGDCFERNGLTYWRGTNYRSRDCYALTLWKTQVEISVDRGSVEQEEMEAFLLALQPIRHERALELVQKPFHELSFHTRTGRGQGEIARCQQWVAPEQAGVVPLPIELPATWVLESVGIGENEMQFIYWDTEKRAYSLWANRHQNNAYYRDESWSRNYSAPLQLGNYECFQHKKRGSVLYQDNGTHQIAYVFRGQPTTTIEQVREIVGMSKKV